MHGVVYQIRCNTTIHAIIFTSKDIQFNNNNILLSKTHINIVISTTSIPYIYIYEPTLSINYITTPDDMSNQSGHISKVDKYWLPILGINNTHLSDYYSD